MREALGDGLTVGDNHAAAHRCHAKQAFGKAVG